MHNASPEELDSLLPAEWLKHHASATQIDRFSGTLSAIIAVGKAPTIRGCNFATALCSKPISASGFFRFLLSGACRLTPESRRSSACQFSFRALRGTADKAI